MFSLCTFGTVVTAGQGGLQTVLELSFQTIGVQIALPQFFPEVCHLRDEQADRRARS